jgi:hypothetical protein
MEQKLFRSKPSMAFATIFLTIATITCVGSAVMLWAAWQELRANTVVRTSAAREVMVEAPSEHLTAAAALAATLHSHSSGTAVARPAQPANHEDQRVTAWLDSTVR